MDDVSLFTIAPGIHSLFLRAHFLTATVNTENAFGAALQIRPRTSQIDNHQFALALFFNYDVIIPL